MAPQKLLDYHKEISFYKGPIHRCIIIYINFISPNQAAQYDKKKLQNYKQTIKIKVRVQK